MLRQLGFNEGIADDDGVAILAAERIGKEQIPRKNRRTLPRLAPRLRRVEHSVPPTE
jgi:hypothetical protein